MSTESNKNVLRRFHEAFDRGDLATCMRLMAPDFSATLDGMPAPLDVKAFRGLAEVFLSAFSNSKHTFETLVAEGDRVAMRASWSAVHTGTFNGIPASNRPVTITVTTFDRIVDGKMAEHRATMDIMGLMQQIGAIPAQAAA